MISRMIEIVMTLHVEQRDQTGLRHGTSTVLVFAVYAFHDYGTGFPIRYGFDGKSPKEASTEVLD